MKKILSILLVVFSCSVIAQEHPNLILTKSGVISMRAGFGKAPIFDQTFAKVKAEVDAEIENGIEVPVPKDLAGGYTHQRHKANFFIMQKAGVLFQITEDEKYATYIKDMLLQYATIFPTFEKHPEERSYATGKFFWQCLNDANWLVYTSQAYDAIYDWLDKETVEKLNSELFRPYAEYISLKNPQFFNRIHNHSTWGNAAVGMIGLVMDDKELIQWALYGLGKDVLKEGAEDNDGGLIKMEGNDDAGFIAQIDHSFSPEGYYTEGPYYQRYAMYPFLIFAQALQNKKPELDILNYRDGLMLNAVYVLIDLSDADDEFFAFNDAQKGMSLASRELVTAVSMAYFYGGKDAKLLSLIENQGRVPLNPSGLAAAEAIENGKAKKYTKQSRVIFDGKDGNEGAIGVLRAKHHPDLTITLKYAKHGMGHGHFDRLGINLFDGSTEVLQDYGAARWVNIKHKDGGGYLKENKTWAKQTVAHNTIVINRESQFGGSVKKADVTHGEHYLFDTTAADVQIISAKEKQAYAGFELSRTIAILTMEELEKPLILDLLSVNQKTKMLANLELPFYYMGELMSFNLEIKAEEVLKPLGETDGYQHLWTEAKAQVGENKSFQMTWFKDLKFYSMTSATTLGDEILFTRIGANDSKFNLRRDPGIIFKRKAGSGLFANAIEVHGQYDLPSESLSNSYSSVKNVKVVFESELYSVVNIDLKGGESYTFCLSKANNKKGVKHEVKSANLEWTGPYHFYKN